jgi:ferric iron reductase FhuF-like transporter
VLLDNIGDPYACWQYAERYLGGGTRTYSRYAADLEISPRFHPQHGAPRFVVPSFWLDPGRGAYLESAIPSELHRIYRSGESFLLPVHPETLTVPALRDQLAGCPAGPPIEVVPSANARTVFVARIDGAPVAPHFLKLHYPKRLSRFTRRLRRQVIALQLWVADELWGIDAPLLPEIGGGVLGHDPVEAWGFLVREPRVRGAEDLPVTVPLFALYGHDVRAPADPTLLEQLIHHSGEDPERWITRRLVEPMVSLWLDVLLRTGCAIELHGQNTLLCLAGDLRATRLAYRDCAIYVDPAIRAARGLTRPLPPRNVISRDVDKPRGHVFSLVYDSFLGHHTLAFVARLAQQRLGVDPAALHRYAQRVFAARGEAAGLLPGTVYYYDDRLHTGGDWKLIDTGGLPQWR